MAGVGIQVKLDDQYQRILDALGRASQPDLRKLSAMAGEELRNVSRKAFEAESDPETGKKWAPLKYPRADEKKRSRGLLQSGGQLRRSLYWQGFDDGSVIFGSNVVYSRIHQEGGQTGAHEIRPKRKGALYFNGRCASRVRHPGSKIPARPYMGVPKDFDRMILTDPAVLKLLGLGP
jgi:phage gpG-like protein